MKILLVNEKVQFVNKLPTLSIAVMGTIARDMGHKVKLIDYQITPNAPSLLRYVIHLRPDIIGFRICNETWYRVSELIDRVKLPINTIIVGGPYPSLHWAELAKDERITSIFIGESEDSFKRFLDYFDMGLTQKIYRQPPPNLNNNPIPDFTLYHNHKSFVHYSLQLSRGCIHNCSFCTTKLINSARWRPRNLEQVFAEIKKAVHDLPNLTRIVVIDDDPTHDINRFKKFLRRYKDLYQNNEAPELDICNIRADKIDMEFAYLLKNCGCYHLVVGVETLNQKAMNLVKKGITPDHVKRASKILRKAKIDVGGTFIMGLPLDDWDSINRTIDYALELKLDRSIWGHLLPFKGTRVRKQVKVLDDYCVSMANPQSGKIITSTASETPYLPEWWQIKAWLRANIKACAHSLYPTRRYIPRYLWYSLKYAEIHNFLKEYLKWRIKKWTTNMK